MKHTAAMKLMGAQRRSETVQALASELAEALTTLMDQTDDHATFCDCDKCCTRKACGELIGRAADLGLIRRCPCPACQQVGACDCWIEHRSGNVECIRDEQGVVNAVADYDFCETHCKIGEA